MLFLSFRFNANPEDMFSKIVSRDQKGFAEIYGHTATPDYWAPSSRVLPGYETQDSIGPIERNNVWELLRDNKSKITGNFFDRALDATMPSETSTFNKTGLVGSHHIHILSCLRPDLITPEHVERCVTFFEKTKGQGIITPHLREAQKATGASLNTIFKRRADLLTPDIAQRLFSAIDEKSQHALFASVSLANNKDLISNDQMLSVRHMKAFSSSADMIELGRTMSKLMDAGVIRVVEFEVPVGRPGLNA